MYHCSMIAARTPPAFHPACTCRWRSCFSTVTPRPGGVCRVLGKRLGKAMGAVSKAVRELDTAALLRYEAEGQIHVAGHTLGSGDLRVVREFKAPPGTNPDHISAAGDGEPAHLLPILPGRTILSGGS